MVSRPLDTSLTVPHFNNGANAAFDQWKETPHMIEAYKSKHPRTLHGTDVAKGQTLYAVRKGDLYFIWSYSNRDFAEQMDKKLSTPTDPTDRAANWRQTTSELTPSDRTGF
jgi:hypothetical protein